MLLGKHRIFPGLPCEATSDPSASAISPLYVEDANPTVIEGVFGHCQMLLFFHHPFQIIEKYLWQYFWPIKTCLSLFPVLTPLNPASTGLVSVSKSKEMTISLQTNLMLLFMVLLLLLLFYLSRCQFFSLPS